VSRDFRFRGPISPKLQNYTQKNYIAGFSDKFLICLAYSRISSNFFKRVSIHPLYKVSYDLRCKGGGGPRGAEKNHEKIMRKTQKNLLYFSHDFPMIFVSVVRQEHVLSVLGP